MGFRQTGRTAKRLCPLPRCNTLFRRGRRGRPENILTMPLLNGVCFADETLIYRSAFLIFLMLWFIRCLPKFLYRKAFKSDIS